ncbi:SDR family oxidoreductase [Nostocaceae cyanobacterium CENA357]|uniref:SDR family oxidoreductase n=1 Tax=Atlanticothrix silvestris CENA357 TaxID=1725252 RepID=A0A8J7L4M1_9CYAN|nr:SDR family oxidoreductase [Atlanticothrix silvestris]MBH8556130.1 SDR family oxidoreductase [Atlanticothrix silvestris CENA357]
MSLDWYSNKVVLITGASKGIGREVARQAAAAGAKVIVIARSEVSLAELASEINQSSGQALAVTADVGNKKQLMYAIDEAVKRFGRIDVAIANAGIEYLGPVEFLKDSELQAMVDTHLFGLFHLTQAVLPIMHRQEVGTIVHVSAPIAQLGFIWSSGYTATKAAADGFISVVRRELANTGIRAITVYPGPTLTEAGAHLPLEQLPSWHLESSNKLLPKDTARQLLEAIAKGKPTPVLAGSIRLLMAMQRWVPALAEWLINRIEGGSNKIAKKIASSAS